MTSSIINVQSVITVERTVFHLFLVVKSVSRFTFSLFAYAGNNPTFVQSELPVRFPDDSGSILKLLWSISHRVGISRKGHGYCDRAGDSTETESACFKKFLVSGCRVKNLTGYISSAWLFSN